MNDHPAYTQATAAAQADSRVQVARLEERLIAVKRELDDMRERFDDMSGKLDLVLTQLSEAKGGWRLLMLLGGGASMVGGFIVWAASHLSINP